VKNEIPDVVLVLDCWTLIMKSFSD